MKILLCALLLLISPPISANGIDERCPQFVVWGAPVSTVETNITYLCRMGYGVNYNNSTKTPTYVVEQVIRENLSGPFKRTNDFRTDNEVPKKYQSRVSDYENSGYDKGHMAPADDFTWNLEAMSESFLLSNIIPQNPRNNRGIWRRVEELQREAAMSAGKVYVISGTIYSSKRKKRMRNVNVPNQIYKIIVDPANEKVIAFIFPNRNINTANLSRHVVTIRQIEEKTGITYLPSIPPNLLYLKTRLGKIDQWAAKDPE